MHGAAWSGQRRPNLHFMAAHKHGQSLLLAQAQSHTGSKPCIWLCRWLLNPLRWRDRSVANRIEVSSANWFFRDACFCLQLSSEALTCGEVM